MYAGVASVRESEASAAGRRESCVGEAIKSKLQ